MTDSLDRLQVSLGERYRIERELGRGGMATVYLAHDEKHTRPVAIKVLEVGFASTATAERFAREIEIAANLTHPRILSLHDSGQVDGLFYYVMPYVEGESVADRLAREKQLPVTDALRITREVAEALAFAHEHGVVHRDIKPSNIMLTTGGAIVADFGIAKALSEAEEDRITRTGQSIGTPGYMSPEQAGGEADVDGRSDQYSLACVLYEMLTGEPPFTGRSAQAVIAKQMTVRAAPVGAVRDTVGPGVDTVVSKALARIPADRFRRIEDFSAALEGAEDEGPDSALAVTRPGPPSALWYALLVAGTIAVVVWVQFGIQRGETGVTDVLPDTSRFAIFPFAHSPGVGEDLLEVQLIRDAIDRWEGTDVVDLLELRDALAANGDEQLRGESAARLAREHGAGRYIRGDITPVGDSIRIVAGLYDVVSNVRIADESIRIDPTLANADSLFGVLVDGLLLRESVSPPTQDAAGTHSLAARLALEAGHRATLAWELSAADSAFSQAADHDQQFAEAHLWTALARMWSGAEDADWKLPAEQAALRPESLSRRDVLFVRAAVAQARDENDAACPLWQEATSEYARDFAAWYGLAHCLTYDRAVLRDASSPSGWSFRTSYSQALNAYQRAFALRPAILVTFQRGSFEPLRETFMIAGNKKRTGISFAPDSMGFDADPAWQGDSLALVPYPRSQDIASRLTGSATEVAEAVRQLRLLFHETIRGWAVTEPESAKAMEALAIAMQLLGDPAALDTLRRAQQLAESPIG